MTQAIKRFLLTMCILSVSYTHLPVSIVKYAITDPDNVDDVLNPLANVDFTLTLKSAIDKGEKLTEGDNLFSGKTDENGRIRWENVPVGTYILHEVKTPEGFIPIDDLIVVVDGSGEEQMCIRDRKKT